MFIEKYVYLKGDIMGNILSDEIMKCYEDAKNEVMERLTNILQSFFIQNTTFGYYICGRIKEYDRIIDKLKRKFPDKNEFEAKFIMENLTDIAGVRIIFAPIATSYNMNYFNKTLRYLPIGAFKELIEEVAHEDHNNNIDIIYSFVKELNRNGFNFMPSRTKDYISKPKESGYMSYHITVVASNGFPVEIQIRNFLQHVYAEAEHARYEGDPEDEKANAILAECASYLRRSNDSYSSGRSL